jgi:hypothetical protein
LDPLASRRSLGYRALLQHHLHQVVLRLDLEALPAW